MTPIARYDLHDAIDFSADCAIKSIRAQAYRVREEMNMAVSKEIAHWNFRARLARLNRVGRK